MAEGMRAACKVRAWVIEAGAEVPAQCAICSLTCVPGHVHSPGAVNQRTFKEKHLECRRHVTTTWTRLAPPTLKNNLKGKGQPQVLNLRTQQCSGPAWGQARKVSLPFSLEKVALPVIPTLTSRSFLTWDQVLRQECSLQKGLEESSPGSSPPP